MPDGVTPPDIGTLPPLGTTPSDNPTEVQLPADLSSSPLPPIETGVQVLEVAPPEGWRPSEDGSVDAFYPKQDFCEVHPDSIACEPPETLDDEADDDKVMLH